MKYGIQVRVEDSWVYVKTGSNPQELKPLLFDNSIAAEDIAEDLRFTGKEQFIKVVPYDESKDRKIP